MFDADTFRAHLALHGFEPVASVYSACVGVYSKLLGIGYAARNDDDRIAQGMLGDSGVKVLPQSGITRNYAPCEWYLITDWHLRKFYEYMVAHDT